MKAKSTYSVKKWNESAYDEISPGMKMTKASVEYAFTGELEGSAAVEYLMFYSHVDEKDQHGSSAMYTGLIRFIGTVAGKSGSFVMSDNGKFEGGTALSMIRIADGSGTDALRGISGNGSYRADKDGCHVELDYRLS